jgi:predicted HTH domain antitoxin
MVRLIVELPEGVLASLHMDTEAFTKELRMAAAVKWYEMKLVSQARAAEIAGVSRSSFLEALGRFHVSPFQYGAQEVIEEAERE